jgi:hypothetical protein
MIESRLQKPRINYGIQASTWSKQPKKPKKRGKAKSLIPIFLNKAALTLSVNGKNYKITEAQYRLFEPLFRAKPGEWIPLSAYESVISSAPRIKASLREPALKHLIESDKQGNGYRICSKYKAAFV